MQLGAGTLLFCLSQYEILFCTLSLADPNLWDSNFTATSLFGTNKFLQSDICNMACSLQCMACFLKQRSLERHDSNNIVRGPLIRDSGATL